MMEFRTWVLLYLAVVNLFGIVLMGYDKLIAGGTQRRVAEKTFYITALVGGSPGILVGMYLFHHKTRKAQFQFILGILLLFQSAILWAFFSRIS